MTIQELKEKKQILEQEILQKILEFEKQTELEVTDIGFEKNKKVLSNSVFKASVCVYEAYLKIEVKL